MDYAIKDEDSDFRNLDEDDGQNNDQAPVFFTKDVPKKTASDQLELSQNQEESSIQTTTVKLNLVETNITKLKCGESLLLGAVQETKDTSI